MIVGPLVSFSTTACQPNASNNQYTPSNTNTPNTPNNNMIAFATAISDYDYIKIWNIEKNMCIQQLYEHRDLIRVLTTLPQNGYLISGSRDKTIKIWDLEANKNNSGNNNALCTLEGHTGGIRALLGLSNNKLISASKDKSIKIWDLRTGQCSQTLKGHQKTVATLGCLEDGSLYSGSSDKTAKIWDLNKNQIVKELQTSAPVESSTVLGDGRLVLGLTNSKITIWEGRAH